ncbi:MAG: hypothetical protein AAGA11_17090 [Pseudomonadota bacterium]
MQSTALNLTATAAASEAVESCTFLGDGVELFGCYAADDANAFAGTGSELYGCYAARSSATAVSGDGAELFGCYQA